jgi:hypothetical protein
LLHFKQIITLLFIAAVTFSFGNFALNGSIAEKTNLSGELKSPKDSLYLWKISKEPPFKYRLLHKAIILGSYSMARGYRLENDTFYFVYGIGAFSFHFLSILLFYYLLLKVDFAKNAIWGAAIFALLPPFLLAYIPPVHTREDMLAYCLLIAGIVATIENKGYQIAIFSIAGVLCRETLLLIPFVNLFFNLNQGILKRLAIASISIAIFVGIRIYLGTEPYNHWEGLNWNLAHPIQVVGFGYLTFGLFWIPFIINLFPSKNSRPYSLKLIYNSAKYVFPLVIVTTFLGGIFNEIRILYLLAPWVIILNIDYYCKNQSRIRLYLNSMLLRWVAVITLIFISLSVIIVFTQLENFITPSKYPIPYEAWIITAAFQLFLGIIFTPYFVKSLMEKE